MFKRWLPRSLTTQWLLLMLTALIVAQVVSIQIYRSERDETLGLINNRFALSRLLSVVRLLQDTPPELHREILRASRSESLSLRVETAPLTPEQRSTGFEQRVRNELNYPANLAIQISVEMPDGPPHPVDVPYPHIGRQHMGRPPARDIRLYGAIQLNNTTWLNFSSFADIEPPAWSRRAVVSLLLMAAILTVLTTWLLRRVNQPLRKLASHAEQYGRGLTLPPIEETGPIEIRETLAAFNRMQLRLDRFVQDRTRMLASISHDLRTPLTSLRLRSEFMPDGEDKERMQQTMTDMEEMLRATLAFSREDQQDEPVRSVDLISLLQSMADDYQDAGQQVQCLSDGQYPYLCRSSLLRRVLQNLVDNALTYAGDAELSLEVDAEQLILRVRDHGPGIPEEALDEVMKPFVRLDSARNTEGGSVGLGLAIARTLIHRQGGELLLANHPDGGLLASLILPR